MRKDPSPSTAPVLSRRTIFVGAGVAGAVGAVAAVSAVSKVQPAPPPTTTAETAGSGGYQLTEHVKQYYATARL